MAVELRPSSPPQTTPAKIEIRTARPAPASALPRGHRHVHQFWLQMQERARQQRFAQQQQQQLLPVTKSPSTTTTTTTTTTTSSSVRGDDSPQTPLSLSVSISPRDAEQLWQQLQEQAQQDEQAEHEEAEQEQNEQEQLQQKECPDARDPDGSQPFETQHCQPMKKLPAGCKIIKMVGEGAANAVFEFTLPDGRYLKHEDTRLLLRVAKMFEEDDRPKFDYHEQYEYYNNCIKPILGSYVLHQELVSIDSPGTIDNINAFLRSINSTRAPKFRGSYVEESKLGFLVEDMRPDDPSKSLLVEFKPKWLSQSPSAPSHAIRCRQCAKELHSYVTEPGLKRPVPTKAKPCPLTLNSEHQQTASDSSQRLVPHLDDLGDDLSGTLDVLRNEEAFGCLRGAQQENDKKGPLAAESHDMNFALAMTLRDCTCFAVVSTQANSRASRPLKVRFGDFDMKMPEFRLEYWQRVEQKLIDGGFYTARWIHCNDSFYRPPTNCVLESAENRARLEQSDRADIIEVVSPEAPAKYNHGLKNFFGSMFQRTGRQPNVNQIQSDVPTLERCLVAYKHTQLKRHSREEELGSWLSSSCLTS